MRLSWRDPLARWTLAFVALNLLDAITTVCILHLGGVEQNPLFRELITRNAASPVTLIVAVKAFATFMPVTFVCAAHGRAPRSVSRMFMTIALALIGVTFTWNAGIMTILAFR